jgi:primase-polymerase (primpol)-like protein
MTCHTCNAHIGPLARADARYCSTRCRVAAHRRQPPAALRRLDRWVRFAPDKRPLRTNGAPASSTDQSTWSTYSDAKASAAGVGVGFVLNGDGIVCVDLDHCVTNGKLEPWATDILAGCPATFTELSVSGSGLHVWGLGDVTKGRKLPAPDGGGIEVYGTARYIAVTGRRWSTSPAGLADISGLLRRI